METNERNRGEGTRQTPPRRAASGSTATAPRRKPSGTPPAKKSQTGAAQRSRGSASVKTPSPNQQRHRQQTPKPSPDVVYVQPAPFNKSRFILCLMIVAAVVLAVIFGMSIFFKVDEAKITVAGVQKYTAWQIREASGIKHGENLLGISEARISSNIINKLPYVGKVRVGIKLPDTVKIEIEELKVVYSVQAEDGSWWLLRSDGFVVEKTNSADAEQHTKLLGVVLDKPQQGKNAVAFEKPKKDEAGNPLPQTVKASEQLATALSIAQYLENCNIIGKAENINVSNMAKLELCYEDRYQVLLGNDQELLRKINRMKSCIEQREGQPGGILDVSFTKTPDKVGYSGF